MRATNTEPDEQLKQTPTPEKAPKPQECSICSGHLVMDAYGTALFCDECWDRKWFLALQSD